MMKKLILAVFLLLCGSLDIYAQTEVQTVNNAATSATAVTISITPTAGNHLTLGCQEGTNNTSTATISTNGASTSWTQVGSYNDQATGRRTAMFYVDNIPSGITGVVCTWSGSLSTTISGFVDEASSVASSSSLDVAASNVGSTSAVTSLTSGTLTTTCATEILIYHVGTATGASSFVAGSGFTIHPSGQNSRGALQYKVVSALFNTTTSMSWTTAEAAAGIFAGFKSSSCGAAAPAAPNKRLKLEQYDNGMAVATGGGVQVSANVLGMLTGPCDPADTTYSKLPPSESQA